MEKIETIYSVDQYQKDIERIHHKEVVGEFLFILQFICLSAIAILRFRKWNSKKPIESKVQEGK